MMLKLTLLHINFLSGNNFYDSALSAKLDEIRNTPEREAYILMDRLLPPTQVYT